MSAAFVPGLAPLCCQQLGLQLGGRTVLRDIDLSLQPGETLGLVGPNGSGKSSLLKLLAGLRQPTTGCISLFGQAVSRLDRRAIARCLALVEQQAHTGDALRVFDAVALGRTPWLSAWAPFQAEDVAIVDKALGDVDALHLRERRWHSLSGGERQRVHIARALAQRPQVLLLDEPTNHLDIQHQLALLAGVQALPVTTLVALHDLNQALTCDRLAVLDQGVLVAVGAPREVLTPKRLRQTFGVHGHYLTDPFDGTQVLRLRAP